MTGFAGVAAVGFMTAGVDAGVGGGVGVMTKATTKTTAPPINSFFARGRLPFAAKNSIAPIMNTMKLSAPSAGPTSAIKSPGKSEPHGLVPTHYAMKARNLLVRHFEFDTWIELPKYD